MAANKSIDRDRRPLEPQVETVAASVADVELAMAELALADLVSDANGEIVFCNDSGFRTLAIRTDSTVVANGQAKPHVTANGDDVGGFQYVTFDNGLTLYYEEGLELVLPEGAEPAPRTG